MDHLGCLVLVIVALLALQCPSVSLEDDSMGSSNVEYEGRGETTAEAEARNLRERRDGYSGGGYGGGGGGYGNYGCHCPYQQCDTNSDLLLYFVAGAALGLLLSLLTAPAMMMAAPAPAPAGRLHPGPTTDHVLHNMLDGAGANWVQLLSSDVAPLAVELMNVYSHSQKEPQCGRRWLCEVTQKAMRQGGLKRRLSSFASVAVSWMMKDMMPFLENLSGDSDDLDCSILAPSCRAFVADDKSKKNKDQT